MGWLYVKLPDTSKLWYMGNSSSFDAFILPGGLAYFLTYFILTNNMVPINLPVNMEVSNAFQASIVAKDLKMYDAVTDTPARVQTSNLIAEIGQVSHIFSDKTGTLTQNVMRLVGVSLEGERWGVKVPDARVGGQPTEANVDSEETALGKRQIDLKVVFADLLQRIGSGSAAASDFLLVLALCHTVVIDKDDQGNPRYNAEGPDEEALVKAAATLGFKLESTDENVYRVRDPRGQVHEYDVLAVNAFNSDRKRMSVLVRKRGESQALLLLKGADSIVAERAVKVDAQIQKDLDAFAQSGLRTLLVARRVVSEGELAAWQADYTRAKSVVGPTRAAELDAVAEKLEKNLEIMGATAIEDALQEGVPETIEMLRRAGIKVWVLTGDKVDTAVNIGFSSRLLDADMHQIYLDGDDSAALEAKLDEYLGVLEQAAKEEAQAEGVVQVNLADWQTKTLALVCTGKAVEYLLAKQKGSAAVQKKFVALATVCAVVLACRVSPAQKALIVQAASSGTKGPGGMHLVSLAIGDGANDVAMIQQARIGVGISGKEGLQAANSADFAIAQFAYLQRLLFVHGRWAYYRTAILIAYVCISWQTLTWALFWYLFESFFAGQQVFSQTLYVSAFAWIACSSIIMFVAFFSRDISPETVLKFPQVYDTGRLNQLLGFKAVAEMFVRAFVYGSLLYVVGRQFLPYAADLDALGAGTYMMLIAIMTMRQCYLLVDWNYFAFLGIVIVFVLYVAIVSFVDLLYLDYITLFSQAAWPFAYASSGFVVGTLIVLEYFLAHYRREFHPTFQDVVQEIDRGYGPVASADGKRPPTAGKAAGDLAGVFAEAGSHMFVIPVKRIAAAWDRRFGANADVYRAEEEAKRKAHAKISKRVHHDDVRSSRDLRASPTGTVQSSSNPSFAQAGKMKPGFAYASPTA